MINYYIKKPVAVRALQYNGKNGDECKMFLGDAYYNTTNKNEIQIRTLEGIMLCGVGDYIIEGVAGEFYPCKKEIFSKTYNKAN